MIISLANNCHVWEKKKKLARAAAIWRLSCSSAYLVKRHITAGGRPFGYFALKGGHFALKRRPFCIFYKKDDTWLTLRPVRPASPIGPPIMKLPQGLMWNTVSWTQTCTLCMSLPVLLSPAAARFLVLVLVFMRIRIQYPGSRKYPYGSGRIPDPGRSLI